MSGLLLRALDDLVQLAQAGGSSSREIRMALEECLRRAVVADSPGPKGDRIIEAVCRSRKVNPAELAVPGGNRTISEIREELAARLPVEAGLTLQGTGRVLGLSTSGVHYAARRWRKKLDEARSKAND